MSSSSGDEVLSAIRVDVHRSSNVEVLLDTEDGVAYTVVVAFQIVVVTTRLARTYSLTLVAFSGIVQTIALCAQASGRPPESVSVALNRIVDECRDDEDVQERMCENLKRVAVLWDRVSRIFHAGPKYFFLSFRAT